MCEDMEKRHRQELQELRESYEGGQCCCADYLLLLTYFDLLNIIAPRRYA